LDSGFWLDQRSLRLEEDFAFALVMFTAGSALCGIARRWSLDSVRMITP
jgi:hypothetical protein